MTLRLPRLAPVVAVLLAVVTASGLPACGGGSAAGCAVTCRVDADCGFGATCGQGACFRPLHFCASAYVAMNDRGEVTDCGYYRCQDGTLDSPAPYGTCARTATSSADCHGGTGWDVQTNQCVCGTSVPGGPPPPPCGWSNLFVPDYGACKPTCGKDADCGTGQMCLQGACSGLDFYCELALGRWTSVQPYTPLDGTGAYPRDRVSCGIYGCDRTTGLCHTDCQDSFADCAPGHGCAGGVCQ